MGNCLALAATRAAPRVEEEEENNNRNENSLRLQQLGKRDAYNHSHSNHSNHSTHSNAEERLIQMPPSTSPPSRNNIQHSTLADLAASSSSAGKGFNGAHISKGRERLPLKRSQSHPHSQPLPASRTSSARRFESLPVRGETYPSPSFSPFNSPSDLHLTFPSVLDFSSSSPPTSFSSSFVKQSSSPASAPSYPSFHPTHLPYQHPMRTEPRPLLVSREESNKELIETPMGLSSLKSSRPLQPPALAVLREEDEEGEEVYEEEIDFTTADIADDSSEIMSVFGWDSIGQRGSVRASGMRTSNLFGDGRLSLLRGSPLNGGTRPQRRRISNFYGELLSIYDIEEDEGEAAFMGSNRGLKGRKKMEAAGHPSPPLSIPDILIEESPIPQPFLKSTSSPPGERFPLKSDEGLLSPIESLPRKGGLQKCAFCLEPLKEGEGTYLHGRYWHTYHSSCKLCGQIIGEGDFAEVAGSLFCSDHHYIGEDGIVCVKDILSNEGEEEVLQSRRKAALQSELEGVQKVRNVTKIRNLFTLEKSRQRNVLSIIEDDSSSASGGLEGKRGKQRYILSWLQQPKTDDLDMRKYPSIDRK